MYNFLCITYLLASLQCDHGLSLFVVVSFSCSGIPTSDGFAYLVQAFPLFLIQPSGLVSPPHLKPEMLLSTIAKINK